MVRVVPRRFRASRFCDRACQGAKLLERAAGLSARSVSWTRMT